MKIYTRTGDKGQTSLFGGKRVLKASQRVETYGTIDELNSVLGVAMSHLEPGEEVIGEDITAIQQDLFAIGAYLANPSATCVPGLSERVGDFERLIDLQTQKLPALRNFILPGGGKARALLHHARTVCRRAERCLVALAQAEAMDDELVKYLNRLSDLLFSMARFVNDKEQKPELIWRAK